MTQEKNKKIHLIYGCIAAVLIIALGIALMVSCWSIYQSGPRPYSRESIGAKLQNISVLIYAVFAIVLGGIALNFIFPLARVKPKAIRDELCTMKKLAAKAGSPAGAEAASIHKEQNLRKLCVGATGLIYAALLVYPAIYLFDRSHFPGADPTAEILKAALIVMPAALLGLAICFACTFVTDASIRRETAIYKQMIAQHKGQASVAPQTGKALPVNAIRWAVLAVAVVFIIAGIFNGSADDVLSKAVKICTECIGLG